LKGLYEKAKFDSEKNLEYEIKTTFKNVNLLEKLINQINSSTKLSAITFNVKQESVYGYC